MWETALEFGHRVLVELWQDGGQRRARRNAWQAMVVDSARQRARNDAQRAVDAALLLYPTAGGTELVSAVGALAGHPAGGDDR